jgi:hypothetical protein
MSGDLGRYNEQELFDLGAATIIDLRRVDNFIMVFNLQVSHLVRFLLLGEEYECWMGCPTSKLQTVPDAGTRGVEGHQHRPQLVIRAVNAQGIRQLAITDT